MYDPFQLVPQLKGCPLSVINVLTMARRLGFGPVSILWLSGATGFSDKPVSRALALLKSYGLVERRSRCGWVLAKEADELVAMIVPLAEEIGAGSANAADFVEDEPINIEDAEAADASFPAPIAFHSETRKNPEAEDLRCDIRNNSEAEDHRYTIQDLEAENLRCTLRNNSEGDIPLPSSSGSSINPDSRNIENLPLLTRSENPENLRRGLRFDSGRSAAGSSSAAGRSSAAGSSSAADSRLTAVLAVLDQGGICEPARSRIAANPRVTPQSAQYHLATCRSTGQAIYRIEHTWAVDPCWQPPDIADGAAADTGGAGVEQSPPSAEEVAAAAAAKEAADAAQEAADRAWEAAEDAFQASVQAIAKEFLRVDFLTWVESLWLGPVEGDVYQVETGNKIGLAWLEQHHVAELLEEALRTITGQAAQVRLVVG